MSNNRQIILDLYSDLKESRVLQMIIRFKKLDDLSLPQQENILESEQNIKNQVNQQYYNKIEPIDVPFIDFIFLYIRWSIDCKKTNFFDSFHKLQKASDQLKNMLGVMTSQHSNLMPFIYNFISLTKVIFKKGLVCARQVQKDENKFISDLILHYQEWISLINKQIKDKYCAYKSQIILKIYNIQLGIRFLQYDFPNCKSIITNTVGYQGFPNAALSKEPKSQQVHYLYYSGRLEILRQQYPKAKTCLKFALQLCPQNESYKQRRQILKYLVPMNIYCGRMPTKELLQEYNFPEYIDLANAVQQGNMFELEQQREKWKKIWLKRSLYLFIAVLEGLTVRNLCKKVLTILQPTVKTQTTFNVDLSKFQAAMEFSAQRTFEIEEVACVLGNLFQRKDLNGYIHKGTIAVFNPKDPCPKIKGEQ